MLPARRLHATFTLRRNRDLVLCSTNLRVCPTAVIVYGRHSHRRIRPKGERHARRACWLRRGHTNSRRSRPRHQSRTNIGACLRSSRHRIRIDHRPRRPNQQPGPDANLRHRDSAPSRQHRFLSTKSSARQSHRQQKHEPLLSRQRRWHANRTRLFPDHQGRRRQIRLSHRFPRRRSRRKSSPLRVLGDQRKDKSATKYLDNTAALRGKPTITVEAGYAGTVETDDVASLVQGTRSVMRLLKMLPGTPHAIDHPVWIKTLGEVTSPVDGIFYPLVKRDTFVEAGRKLGDVTDYFGKVIFEARAPVTGIILHICAVPSMKKGDNIANIGVIAPQAP